MADEFKFEFNIRDAKTKETIRKFSASDELCAELAGRFGIDEIDDFNASFVIHELEPASLYQVKVGIKASAKMETVSGDVISVSVDDVEEDCYTTRKDLAFSDAEDDFDPYAPEYIEHGIIDLADMAFDYLALMLDEAFKEEMAEFVEEGEVTEKSNQTDVRKPFANLKDLIDQKDEES